MDIVSVPLVRSWKTESPREVDCNNANDTYSLDILRKVITLSRLESNLANLLFNLVQLVLFIKTYVFLMLP